MVITRACLGQIDTQPRVHDEGRCGALNSAKQGRQTASRTSRRLASVHVCRRAPLKRSRASSSRYRGAQSANVIARIRSAFISVLAAILPSNQGDGYAHQADSVSLRFTPKADRASRVTEMPRVSARRNAQDRRHSAGSGDTAAGSNRSSSVRASARFAGLGELAGDTAALRWGNKPAGVQELRRNAFLAGPDGRHCGGGN